MSILSKRTLQWLSLVGIIWLQAISGTNTNFPAYSSELKASLSLSQLQLNNLAFASDAGKLFGFIAGLAADFFPFPTVLFAGAFLGLAGYGFQFLSVAGEISPLKFWQVFALTALAGNSICWLNTVCYSVAVKNFPARFRQSAVGLATSYQGLSAKLYSDLFAAINGEGKGRRAETYLLMNSVSPMVVCLFTAPFVTAVNSDAVDGNGTDVGFVAMLAITAVTGIYSVMTVLGLGFGGSNNNSRFLTLVGTAVLMAAPVGVPAAMAAAEKWKSPEKKVHSVSENNVNVIVEVKVENGGGDDVAGIDDVAGGVREEIGALEMVKRVDFWVYLMVYFGSVTVGLVYLNNLGQIGESRGCTQTSSLVSLSSSFGFFGRLMPSLLDYHFSRSKNVVSKPGLIAILAAPMAGAFFLLLDPSHQSLHVSTAVIGICTGAITSLSVSTTSELFGTQNFSVNHNVLVANIPIGSFLFGYLAAVFYNSEGNRFVDGKCMGMNCYRYSFIVWGCMCLIGTFLAFVLYLRTRKFYFSQSRT